MVLERSPDGEPPGAGGKGDGAPVGERPAPSSAARAMIEQYLGDGDQKPRDAAWSRASPGRHCLVYLHVLADGTESVTSFDTARLTHKIALTFSISGSEGLAALKRELVSITTSTTPAPPPAQNGA